MTKNEIAIERLKLQFETTKMRAMYSHASVVSGHAETRSIIDGAGHQLTKEAKLEDELATMRRHIYYLDEIENTIIALMEKIK